MMRIHSLRSVSSRQGFTLIELMVVIVILGILTMAALTNFQNAQMRGRDAKRKSSLKQVATALELYYNDYGSYPATGTNNVIKGCGSSGTSDCAWDTTFSAGSSSTIYMPQLPKDPTSSQSYRYEKSGEGYYLFARLENGCDIDTPGVQDGTQIIKYYSSKTCGGSANCNFVVTSPNLAVPAVSSTGTSCN